jgi:hypothetical protein
VAAALNVIEGADHVARFLVGTARKGLPDSATLRVALVNGLPGLLVEGPDGMIQTVAFEVDDDRVRTVYAVRNPDKLRHLAVTSACAATRANFKDAMSGEAGSPLTATSEEVRLLSPPAEPRKRDARHRGEGSYAAIG